MSNEHEEKQKKVIAVSVITPSGIYPGEDDYRRASEGEIVGHFLEKAASHLRITDTTDWDAFVEDRKIDLQKTFIDNDLHGIIEIEWHKHEGGGGA